MEKVKIWMLLSVLLLGATFATEQQTTKIFSGDEFNSFDVKDN